MNKYRVVITGAMTEYYRYDCVIEAENEQEAALFADDDFMWDISPWSTGESEWETFHQEIEPIEQ